MPRSTRGEAGDRFPIGDNSLVSSAIPAIFRRYHTGARDQSSSGPVMANFDCKTNIDEGSFAPTIHTWEIHD